MKQIGLIVLLLILSLQAATVEELFQKGNSFYSEKNYDSAAFYYDEALIIEESSALLYNRGNCAYRLGELGEAIWLYEKALLRNPQSEDIQKSLAFVETQIIDKKVVTEASLFEKAFTFLQDLMPLTVQFWTLFTVSILFTITLYFILFRAGNRRILYIYVAGIILFIYLIFGGSAIIKIVQSESDKSAVILVKSCNAVNEPLGKTVIFSAHEGTKVKLIKNSGEWVQVALSNGTSGWIRRKDLGIVE